MAETKDPDSAATSAKGPVKYSIHSAKGMGCWFVQGKVEDREVRWLLDTGAAPNVLSLSSYLSMPASVRPDLSPSKVYLQGADGGQLSIHGEIDLMIVFDSDIQITTRVIVADLGEIEGILGMRFLEENACDLDLNNGYIKTSSFDIPLFKLGSAQCCPLTLTKSVTLCSGYETMAMVIFETDLWDSQQTLGLVEADSDFGGNPIYVPRVLVKVSDSPVGLLLTNLGEKTLTLPAGMPIACLVPISDVFDLNAHSDDFVTCIDQPEENGQTTSCPVYSLSQLDSIPFHLASLLEETSSDLGD